MLAAVLVVYLVAVGQRGVLLILDGRPAFVLLGIGVLILPLLGGWIVVKELSFGRSTERLAAELSALGALPADDLPRRPSGRVDRAAADAAFAAYQREVEAAPASWAAWFRLALAYDAAGDRVRARRAMRRAIALHTATPPPQPQPPR